MKYLFYKMYREDSNNEKLRPTDEMLSVTGLLYDDDLSLVTVTSHDFADILIPMGYNDYLELLNAFKKTDKVELSGLCAFTELTKDDFDYEMTEKSIEEYNNAYLERVRSFNIMNDKKITVL